MERFPRIRLPAIVRFCAALILLNLCGPRAIAQTAQPTKMSKEEPKTAMEQFNQYIQPYDPIYFLMGPESPAVKFQFSLKVVPFTNLLQSWVQPSVAYTQTSFWDIFGPSSPFFDTSYKPTAFVYFPNVFQGTNVWQLDLQSGYQHESNGRGGSSSRSMNTIYLQGSLRLGDANGWHGAITPRAWFYILDLSDNPDIANYRGYANIEVKGGYKTYELRTRLQMGESAQHVGVQVDLTAQPLRQIGFMPYFHIQYWNGYGETFLEYKKYTQSIRFGLGLFE